MSKVRHYVEVVLKDGNRILNVEVRDDYTVLEVLVHNLFKWEANSIFINGEHIPDNVLDIPMNQFLLDKDMKPVKHILITMKGVKEKRPEKAAEQIEEQSMEETGT